MSKYFFNKEEDRVLHFKSRMHKAQKQNPDCTLKDQSSPLSATLTEEVEKEEEHALVCNKEKFT